MQTSASHGLKITRFINECTCYSNGNLQHASIRQPSSYELWCASMGIVVGSRRCCRRVFDSPSKCYWNLNVIVICVGRFPRGDGLLAIVVFLFAKQSLFFQFVADHYYEYVKWQSNKTRLNTRANSQTRGRYFNGYVNLIFSESSVGLWWKRFGAFQHVCARYPRWLARGCYIYIYIILYP